MTPKRSSGLGPLENGQLVAIVGGGPAGVSCAIALRNLAQQMGRDLRVLLYEGKVFSGLAPHYNQCAGVLSPPIEQILWQKLQVPFPWHLVQRRLTGYILHSDRCQLLLTGDNEICYVVRRVQFDDYLLEQAAARGVEVIHSRVTDLEFHADHVLIYSESDTQEADVVVGAFGLDDGTARMFERVSGYRPPKFLDSVVTKVHPSPEFLEQFGNVIHAFLPSLPEIEFGAVTPKGNHLTINIAGARVNSHSMGRFLALPAVRSILPGPHQMAPPDTPRAADDFKRFKGKFPVSVARGIFGDRFVIVGDAAGLIRPFKGKGVNAGCIGGAAVAENMMRHGISRRAFAEFLRSHPYCQEVLEDRLYARLLRWLASASANRGFLDAVLELAEREERLRRALFYCVSAHRPYKQIVWETVDLRLGIKATRAVGLALLRSAMHY